jgi:hypothetical protein
LGNTNALGEHIVVGSDGKVWRVNNSGALGQGSAWSKYPTELWSMRNGSPYQDLDYAALTEQMKLLEKTRGKVLDELPSNVKALMAGRYDTMADLVKISNTLQKDNWQIAYIDDFSRHSVGLRDAGIVEQFPKELTKRPYSTVVSDENGKVWDNLRGYSKDTAIGRFSDYLLQNGGDHGIIQSWASSQSGNSWSSAPQALKYFLANQRTLPLDSFYWHYDIDGARIQYDAAVTSIGEKKYRETWVAWHAFNYEFVRNVKFANNLHSQGVIKLMRTERLDVMKKYNMVPGQVGQMKRGAAESTSIFKKVTVNGHELTTQRVPHHRIFGSYMFERYPGSNMTLFMSNDENEFIAMMEGLEVKYGR